MRGKEMGTGGAEEEKRESEERAIKRRLRGVRKRKRAQKGFKCEVMAHKMRLVEITGGRDR